MRLTVIKANFIPFFFLALLLAMTSSCSVLKSTKVKNYPIGKPFVFKNQVVLNADISKDEKNRLTTDLDNYWDDSLKSREIKQFFIFTKIKNPPVFDSANVTRSVNFMNAYLNSQGYYYASFKDSVKVDSVNDQLRTTVTININLGKNITIDSVSFDLGDSTLQKLTRQEEKNTFLKKGVPYTKQVFNSELDRLVGLYRQNGFFNFTREDIYVLVDSADAKLFQLTLDPFKQAQIIAEADRNRRINPKWDVTVLKRPTFDSSELTQYHIGKLYYYPETKITDATDSLPDQKGFLEFKRNELVMRYKKGLFNYIPLQEHTYLHSGDLYNENKYFKTINTLGQLGAWQQVDGKPVPRGKDSLDIYFFLVPAIKQNYTIDLEGSRNTADIGLGNLWGISTNFTYNNRNVWKRAIQSIATFRTGVELNILTTNNDQLIQTFLLNLGHTYVFPKLILPFKGWKGLENLDNKRTLFSVNGTYIDRREYYQLRSLVTSWGYEWKKGNNTWLYKPLNIELYAIDKLPKLDALIKLNPFLKASFNEGKVVSQSLTFIKNFSTQKNPNKSHYIRFGVEEAGGILGLISGLKDQIYRYVKVEAEYRKLIKMGRTDLAWRAFAGVGYNYGQDPVIGKTLPFFKQFSAGGPYSMRAWGLRQLGMGSSIQSDTISTTNYRDRFGDMQLEANVEYRFPLVTVAGVKIASAFFADMGNVWNVKKDVADPKANFAFGNLIKDLAIGVGSGLRIDFSYFLIRLDFAYKVKDPARQYNNGWMTDFKLAEYRQNGLKVNNYAFQLGIGMPF